ncbi:MAG: preprotein translocase subunit SecG [Candidatus Omnitrophota bacterium]|nr:MAG: preprotein translocase subunit SecG [Candidatus Omnitrophota bacterium]
MYALIITIHVIACLILIVVILLQSGRGGGLAGMFGGGGATQTIFGVRTPKFLTRATTAAAIAFLLTCISLTVLSSKRVRSLMSGVKEIEIPEEAPSDQTQAPQTQEEKPEESDAEPEVPQE